jgi:tetratricopeptide (TPR) repeat protein
VPKVVGLSDRPQGAGRHVLRLLAKNDEKNALRLLDWLAKDLRPRSFMDGVAQRFSQTWGAKVSRTRKDMELAAAVLSGTTDPARAIPILAQCQPATSDAQLACDWSLSDLYRETAKWSELEDHARTWATRAPKSLTIPTLAEAYGLAHLGRPDDGEAVIAEALAKDPDNHSLIFVHADMAIARGNLKEAIKRIEPLTTKSTATSSDCNNTSWIKLFEGSDLPGAATLGRKAVALAPNEPHAANTLAAVEAEIGELGEAKTHLDISVSADDGPTPSNADLYVHGRILEQLGFTDDAIATYRKIKDHPDTPFTPSSFDFTARRLKALGVKK